ncbi:hypothetical protein LTR37_021270 [Vermiconidia calcicola]|uniref:Uncharacterized protein n=1 Tax=Vermiconidia calcicola TaxID=1690605 RepID=A0ACC3MA64_9PEZI|nr:hypothetical protein LTR37_021270 [Vermiconidia calcicola]
MASYYDADDSRTRPSRRNDPYQRPRDEDLLKPTTGARDSGRRVGETSTDGQNNGYSRKQRSPNRYAYDSRYGDYPPPLPPDTGRPPAPARRAVSSTRRRNSWPPKASCEDEAASLAKEAGSKQLLKEIGKDEVRSRGSVDQEPMILEVPEYINQDERRFVLDRDRPSSDLPTPPSSEDERTRKARRRPSKLNMKFDKLDENVPEMNKRTSSPYAYTNPKRLSKDDLSFDRFTSPDSFLSPPPADPSNTRRQTTKSQPSSPRRDSARYGPPPSTGRDYFSLSANDYAIDDDHPDGRDKSGRRDPNKPRTHPPSRDAPNTSPRTSVVDFAPQSAPPPAQRPVTQPSASIRKLNIDARRNTDTEGTLPRMRADHARRPTPLVATSALSDLDGPVVSSPQTTLSPNELPLPRSRHVSPANSINGDEDSRRSSRYSAEFSREHSSNASKAGSVPGSRAQSPSPRTPVDSPRIPRTDLDWSAVLAANAARRSKPTPRVSSALRQETMPAPSRPDSRTESLPYPVEDGPAAPVAWMPSERTHQYLPHTRPSLQIPIAQESHTISRSTTPGPSNASYLSTSSGPVRPTFQARHSAADVTRPEVRKLPERPRANEGRRVSFTTSSQTKQDLQALQRKGLPDCPRTKPVAGYSDWYTVIGAPPSLDICPSCVDHVERTVYRNCFRRSPPTNLETKVQCALGGRPWLRLAWLLTLQQQRLDLKLLVDLAVIEEISTPCPGDREAIRTWFGLRDSNGMFVKDFRICYSDVRKIECMLPELYGMFVKLPARTADDKGICAIRPEGNRFSIYVDALISTHEKAMAAGKKPDPTPFISLVQWRQQLRECKKDSLLKNGLWHFIPDLEEFTVCEDCFETVVEPEIRRDNEIAKRFYRSIQTIYGEGMGISCQLYSPRMRKVFQRAIEDNDFKYLIRKARERRDAELRLQQKYWSVVNKAKRLSWESAGSEDDERRLDREIRRITEEWQNEWE